MPINELRSFNIDNTQLTVMTPDDEAQAGSAMAFMQGLYPPRDYTEVDEENMYAPWDNGTGGWIQYPLDGYQYPHIDSLGLLDLNYIWYVKF